MKKSCDIVETTALGITLTHCRTHPDAEISRGRVFAPAYYKCLVGGETQYVGIGESPTPVMRVEAIHEMLSDGLISSELARDMMGYNEISSADGHVSKVNVKAAKKKKKGSGRKKRAKKTRR